MTLLFILGLALFSPISEASPPAHNHQASPTLRLNGSEKWRTDDVLRSGMTRLQGLLLADLGKIHEKKFTLAQYTKLSDAISGQVAQVFKDCKHNPGADEMLHIVLLKVIKSSDKMKKGNAASRREAAVEIAKALNEYGVYFDHQGWQSIDP